MLNPFEILGLSNNCEISEVKKHFRKISLKLHPDKGGDESEYAIMLDAYKQIIDGYRVDVPVYVHKTKENLNITQVDMFITLKDGFNGCNRNVYLKDGVVNIAIPKGILPMQSIQYAGCGEMNSEGIRGVLSVTVKFVMPSGFTFERYLAETVLVYSIKFKKMPKDFSVTLNGKTKKINMPSKIYDGMFLKIKDFGYVNNGIKHPLYIRLSIM